MLEILCVVDDDKIFTYLLKRIIEKAKIAREIIFFENGRDALDYLANHRDDALKLPQLILLDINMPILDGWQFLSEYGKLEPTVPQPISICMMSSSSDLEDYDRAMGSGHVMDYLQKPVQMPSLKEVTERVLSFVAPK
ncbi:response regulator [Dyadobacter fermentans]|uniref:Response regulator receiver protein n=1 Tax=Dyadobacter fermentans (strain ATCC 700827 / DSM 18053 / CIP 107007 / KCTC 52180 / NS114) TaxID=471854 RepID=C6VVM5_DYAFD|nr:response regulator [Dyadobacter fermentans]ACT96755.1 response regulator receiver protein [Dyadobacter fermentans DSM 18053]